MGDAGPVPAALGVLGEPVYRVVVRARNRAFDRGKRVTRLPLPVVSVGNLSVGGTGKTPFVMTMLEMLRAEGLRPAIAMRGYKAAPGEDSDEQAEYRDRFGADVPIVARPDRVAGVRALLAERNDVDCIVLDDGFQHRFLARDLDVVLVDATRDPFDDRCLPRGWLREPATSLARAGAIVITRVDRAPETNLACLESRIKAVTDAPIFRAAHAWDGIELGDHAEPPEWLAGALLVVACAIGNPTAFLAQLEAAGAQVGAHLIERDHHAWSASDVRRLADLAASVGADAVVTTAKDWVKLRRLDLSPLRVPVARPRVRLDILTGRDTLRDLVIGAAAKAPRGVAGAASGATRA